MNDKPRVVEFDKDGNIVQNLYTDPLEFEHAIVFMKGTAITLECGLTIHIPRWSVAKAHELGNIISSILSKIFPDDMLFLMHNDFLQCVNSEEKFTKLYMILMDNVFSDVRALIRLTIGSDVYDKTMPGGQPLESFLTFSDYLLCLATIINQEINNPLFAGLIKKVTELLHERQLLQPTSSTK